MHGGDIYRNKISYDFSVNVNPLGVPEAVQEAIVSAMSNLTHYPDPQNAELKQALATEFEIDKDQILCGNGASELILATCHALKVKKAILLAPSFTGYETALDAVGAEKIYVELGKEDAGSSLACKKETVSEIAELLERQKPELMIITNPNNPTGRLVEKHVVLEIASLCKRNDCILMVDECFMELTGKREDYSLTPCMKSSARMTDQDASDLMDVLVLRAFTKSFAIPGLRLGYMLCGNKMLADLIQRQLPEWNVSVLASAAGIAALKEKAYLKDAVQLIQRERAYLMEALAEMGIYAIASDANFILFSVKGKAFEGRLKEELLGEEILIRSCMDYVGLDASYYRIAVKTHEENEILVRALRRIYG